MDKILIFCEILVSEFLRNFFEPILLLFFKKKTHDFKSTEMSSQPPTTTIPHPNNTNSNSSKVFIQRDYSDGTTVKFHTRLPIELEGLVSHFTLCISTSIDTLLDWTAGVRVDHKTIEWIFLWSRERFLQHILRRVPCLHFSILGLHVHRDTLWKGELVFWYTRFFAGCWLYVIFIFDIELQQGWLHYENP